MLSLLRYQVELHTQKADRKGNMRSVMHEFMIGREHEDKVMRYIADVHASVKKEAADASSSGAGEATEAGNGAGAAGKRRVDDIAVDDDDDDDDDMSDGDDSDEDGDVARAKMLAGELSSDEDEFNPEAESDESCGEEYDENHESEEDE